MTNELDFARPFLLQADNFTPLSRTPWAGQRLARTIKSDIVPDQTMPIGESWEVSCDPALLSKLVGSPGTLSDWIARAPEAMLSPLQAQRTRGQCEILLKLLNAAEPLSLQVHPTDADPHLKTGECGKPESWLILDAEPGAGLYLGFSRAMSRAALKALLEQGEAARDVLQFVPVKVGDYFEIEAGVPHAIGPGITLLEPQRVSSGLSGKTYRMWDWGRRYNAHGQVDPKGQARELHLEAALELVDPERQVGGAFVASLRRSPRYLQPAAGVKVSVYPPNPYYQTIHCTWEPGAHLNLHLHDGYAALVPLEGALDCLLLSGQTSEQTRISKGQPVFLPHAAMPLRLTAVDVDAVGDSRAALVIPAGARLEF